MKHYLVGGAVRDKQLGLTTYDRDWVVVGSTPDEMQALGFQPVGKDFPVFLHPQTKEEYALARTERKTGPGYSGFDCYFAKDVTLEDDLQRRDLTINAMAENEDGQIVDPHHGQRDLEQRLLRHVSPAFVEDPVRILRVARFAARFHHLGFRVADDTQTLMQSMVQAGEVDHLVPERVWKEMSRALLETTPSAFFQVLRECGALARIIPELDALFGIPQPERHHPEIDTGVHAMMVLEQACRLSNELPVRVASLLHDLGKGTTPAELWPSHHGHEQRGVKLVKQVCRRLHIPNDCAHLSTLVAEYHTHCHRARQLTEKSLVNLFKTLDAYRRPERFEQFLLCCQADARGRTGFENAAYPQADYLRGALALTQTVSVQDIIAEGYQGKAISEQLQKRQQHNLKHYRREYGAAND